MSCASIYINNVQPYFWDLRNVNLQKKRDETFIRIKKLSKMTCFCFGVSAGSFLLSSICEFYAEPKCAEMGYTVVWRSGYGFIIASFFSALNGLQYMKLNHEMRLRDTS